MHSRKVSTTNYYPVLGNQLEMNEKNTFEHLQTLKPIVQQRKKEQELLAGLLQERTESNGGGGCQNRTETSK